MLTGFISAVIVGLHTLMAWVMMSVVRDPVHFYVSFIRGHNPFRRQLAYIYAPLFALAATGIVYECVRGRNLNHIVWTTLVLVYSIWVVGCICVVSILMLYVTCRSNIWLSDEHAQFKVTKLFAMLTALMWLSWGWVLVWVLSVNYKLFPSPLSVALDTSYFIMFPLGGFWNALIFHIYLRKNRNQPAQSLESSTNMFLNNSSEWTNATLSLDTPIECATDYNFLEE